METAAGVVGERRGAPPQSGLRREFKGKSDISENTNGFRSTGLFLTLFLGYGGASNRQTNGNSKCRIWLKIHELHAEFEDLARCHTR